MTRVCVLKGGWSAEREVSLASGAHCAQGLTEAGFDVTEFDVSRDIGQLVSALKGKDGSPPPDVAFNALHGSFGEDGCIQGLLNMLDIAYTHSGVYASATAMDKVKARAVFAGAGITVAEAILASPSAIAAAHPMAPPYVVKPRAEGSSVGVHIVEKGAAPFAEIAAAQNQVLVERYIPGAELTVAVTGDGEDDPQGLKALAVTELRPLDGFYNYDNKYTGGRTEHLLPAPIPEPITDLALKWAKLAHKELGCRGISRADFRFDSEAFSKSRAMNESSGLVMLEVNTQPGMTPGSLVPEQTAFFGISFPELVTWLVERAKCD